MGRAPVRLRVVTVFALLSLLAPAAAIAQPAPSFQVRCGELREALKRVEANEHEEPVTIEVVGELQIVREKGGLAFLGLCGPPDPRVLCITYDAIGRLPGERVVVVGSLQPTDTDFVQLDPCLHYTPTGDDKN